MSFSPVDLRLSLVLAVCLCGVVFPAGGAEGLGRVDVGEPVDDGEGTWRLRVAAGGTYSYGPIRGYVQTPSGGAPGTSSLRRPTFKELDIDDAGCGRFRMSTQIGSHTAYVGVDPLRLSGSAVLDTALTTRSVVFPAGSRVSTDITLDRYRVGYQYAIPVGGKDLLEFEVAPIVEVTKMEFKYRLNGAGGARVSRIYSSITPRLGIEAKWFVTDDLTLAGRLLGSIPIDETVYIWNAELKAEYAVSRGGVADVTLAAGVEFEHLDYEDAQTLSNHIRMEFGPALVLSLHVAF